MEHLVSIPPRKYTTQGGERCARLHQRKDYQDRKLRRGDKENCPSDSERIWCF